MPRAKIAKSRETTRVQFMLPARAFARLGRIAEAIEAASEAEVIRTALKYYELTLDRQVRVPAIFSDPPVAGEPKRVQAEFGPRAHRRLRELKKRTEASSGNEVVRSALKCFEQLLKLDGREITRADHTKALLILA